MQKELTFDRSVEGDAALNGIVRRVSWRFLPFLMLCYIFAYLDRVNIGFAKDSMSADFGLSAAAYGFGAGIFFLGYFLFEVPSNLLLQRFGARRWISRIMITWAIVSAAFAFVDSTWSFYVLRLLLGIAEAGFFPGIVLFLTQWWPAARRAQIIAVFMTAIPIAGLIGGPLSGAILAGFDGYLGIAGWRWMFAIEAIPAFLFGLLVLRVLDSRIEDARWLNDEDKAVLIAAVGEPAGQRQEKTHGVLSVLVDPKVLGYAAIYFCCIMGQYGITFWLPTLIANASGGGALAVGLLGAIPYGFAVACMIVVSRHSDATGERRWHTIAPMVLGGLTLMIVPVMRDHFGASMTLMTLAAGSILTATPLFWTLPTRSLSGRSAVVGIAAINSAGNLAGFLSPLVVGWLTQWTKSLTAGMMTLSLFLIGGGLLAWLFTRDQRSAL